MKHFTREQRYTIFHLRQKGCSQTFIAEALGVSQSSISRELLRNSNTRGEYWPNLAHKLSHSRKSRFCRKRKFYEPMEDYIRDKLINEQWSPRQIVGYAKQHQIAMISHEWIYHYIREDKASGGTLYKHLRHRLKYYRHRLKRSTIPDRVSIHERPPEVDARISFGHWEMDTVVGSSGKSVLLTLVERQSRFMMMKIIQTGKKSEDLAKEVVELLQPYKKIVKTITTDNGTEFRKHKYICKKLDTTVYFTDPYSSWQKGAIENVNKLIRQYFPKKTNFDTIDHQQIKNVQYKLNRRPRENLNFNSPFDYFAPFC